MKTFTIIILNWNNYKETKEAIDSCLKLTYPNKKIIVVDNASNDDSDIKLKENYPKLIHLQTRDNLGYTGGNNFGIKKAMELQSDYIMILNNDTVIKNQNFIENILEIFNLSKDVGIIGPVILDKETNKGIDKYQNSFFLNLLESHVNNKQLLLSDNNLKNVNRVCGCAIIFSRDVLEKCIGFDESFFMYAEEMDICYRAKLSGKYVIKIEDERIATVMRKNEIKIEKGYIWYYMTRNYFYLIQKHHSGTRKFFLYCLNIVSSLLKIIRFKRFLVFRSVYLAFIDFLNEKKGRTYR